MSEARLSYRGKHFTLPEFSSEGFTIAPRSADWAQIDAGSPILEDLGSIWDVSRFQVAREPMVLGALEDEERAMFSKPGLPRVLDMPIKFPGSQFRVPGGLEQLGPVIQRVADVEAHVNQACYDEFYCYLTIDQGPVRKGRLQREAPCHVDGFQGARWRPKVRINHSYVLGDSVPTTYYPMPFDFSGLDEARHNFFWEMNRQVAAVNSAHRCWPKPYELALIDAYTVHRGTPAEEDRTRTWVRLSFETRIFDRLGNAHNPLFCYDWKMVKRDIEGLGLTPFDSTCDPSLRVFPWQRPDGSPYEDPKERTQPNLQPLGA